MIDVETNDFDYQGLLEKLEKVISQIEGKVLTDLEVAGIVAEACNDKKEAFIAGLRMAPAFVEVNDAFPTNGEVN
jgi:hypothetical protein